MTDENRAELRRGLEMLVRASARIHANGWPAVNIRTQEYHYSDGTPAVTRSVEIDGFHPGTPPLTTAQQLALSVLLGDESAMPQALADFMIDSGVEYAVECYEKGKRDGNPLLVFEEAGRELAGAISGALAAPPGIVGDENTT